MPTPIALSAVCLSPTAEIARRILVDSAKAVCQVFGQAIDPHVLPIESGYVQDDGTLTISINLPRGVMNGSKCHIPAGQWERIP